MLLGLCLSILLAPQGATTVKTDFLPSRDLPNFQNPSEYINPAGSRGMCNGIDELALAYLDVRRNNPNAFTLREIAATIEKYHGKDYLRETMARATEMSYSAGRLNLNMRRDPKQFVSEAVSTMQTNQRPISLVLLDSVGRVHRITAYGAVQTADGWTLNVSDSNNPNRSTADQITLTVNGATGGLTINSPGQPADTYSQGGIVPKPAMLPAKYIEMINMAIIGKPMAEIREKMKPVEANPIPQEAIDAQKDPKTGGVLIRFDPALFSQTADEGKLADINKRLGAFMQSAEGGAVILTPQARTRKLSLVPFSSISPSGTLGGLTRVEGFVVKPDGTASLVGEKEQGQEPIPSEWLVVALQAQYAKGMAPYISLDPDPQTYSGPQRVRIGDVPDNLRSSSFIKAMLDADYLMKKINLRKEAPKIEGFKSWEERMEAADSGGAVRMWFTPMALPSADSFIFHSKGSLAVVFESQVKVLSAREMAPGETGFVEGARDPVAEQAAQDFSLALDRMSLQYPEIHRLRGVFDVSKLAACWRTLTVKPSGIDAWLSAVPRKVEIPASYVGIGPDMTPGGYAVSGGAIADAKFKEAATVETDRLAPLFASSDASEATIEFPATMPLSEATRAGFEAQNLLAAATAELDAGQLDDSLAHLEQVLILDPNDTEALSEKASALTLLKRYPEALALADTLAPRAPGLVALRAVIKGSAGDAAGATADADQAEAALPDNEVVLMVTTTARILARDTVGASRSLRKLRLVSPANPVISKMDSQIELISFLGPEKAKERLALQAEIPVPVAIAMQQSAYTPQGLAAYKEILENIKSGAVQVPEKLFIKERLRLVLATSTVMRKPEPEMLAYIGKEVDQMVADHPDWPSSYYARMCVMAAINAPPDLTAGTLDKFAELEPKSDPILPELQLLMRVPRIAPYMAVLTSLEFGFDPKLRQLCAELASDYCKGLPGGPFLKMLADHPNLSAAALEFSVGSGEPIADANVMTKALDQMTESVEGIPPGDPAFIAALDYCANAIRTVTPGTPEYERVTHRSLALASAGAPSRFLVPLAVSMRSKIFAERAIECSRKMMSPQLDAVRALKPVTDKMDRLLKPESAQDSLQSVGKTLNALVVAMSNYLREGRADVDANLGQIRKTDGDFAADVVTFGVTEMEIAVSQRDETKDDEKLVALHPGIEKTLVFSALESLGKDISGGIMHKEAVETAWARVLVGIKTRYDGLTVQELLSFLKTTHPKNPEVLNKFLAQAKAKTDLGTGWLASS